VLWAYNILLYNCRLTTLFSISLQAVNGSRAQGKPINLNLKQT